ncbi:MAG: excinuclease ABC subunit UvrC [Betaproteobacteria bacterium]|nr:MAG: excinuclease ABC subunit UvrC [Betaproteobacteria bacterium]
MFNAKAIYSSLPSQPGVYRMLNAVGQVIYVGKAIDLRKRVSSYFQKTNLAPRIQLMVSQITGIETTVTRSESEALLLENNLIKTLTPHYNILFRDDKSYPYIVLTKHAFPRLGFHRGSLNKQHHYFGHFPNAGIVRESIQLLQKVFRIRTCEDSVFNNRTRPCLLYQIKRCSAPCVKMISNLAYREDIRNAELFLQGKQTEVLESLAVKMRNAANYLDYERAVLYRDQIQTLRRVREKQFVDSGKALDADVVACAVQCSGGKICVNLAMVRGGRHLGDKNFFPQNAEGYDPPSAVEAFLSQHYLNRFVPPLIIVGEKIHREALQASLAEQSGHKITISLNPKSERRVWLDMATKNAHFGLKQQLGLQVTQEERLQVLQHALEIINLTRIECFDISHTQGEATVASCVVYDNFSMRNGEYRRYNIGDITPGDDYAAMRDVLSRRYHKVAEGKGRLPDLILVDGGKGQVNAAQEALVELGLNYATLVGVSKGRERKPGLEQLVFPGTKKSLQLSKDHPGLHLIQQIRDEAHRFAIQGHRAKRGKSRVSSYLVEIDGIGNKRRQNLLVQFGGLKGVLTASIEELQQVEGISRALAEKIYKKLH